MTSDATVGRRAVRVLIVDDDPGQRSLLDTFLRGQGFLTTLAESGEEALQLLGEGAFDLMISDVRMPGISGLETLRRARRDHAVLPVLLVTAYADIRDAVSAMRDGALNYLSKPIDLDELLAAVRQATGCVERAVAPVGEVQEGGEAGWHRPLPPQVVVKSPLMDSVFRDVALIAGSDSRVLITGESGVGKEVVADTLHRWSPRHAGPLVKVNCAAIPENLLESELFGHERGAFSGAVAQRIGRFEAARGGTILLDEISEMSPQLQAKLLRVTQDGRFQRVGSNVDLHTDARVLAATNRNLEDQVKQGRFREDLFYRLNVVELNIPALRERPEDILPLANSFGSGFSRGQARLSSAAAEVLERYAWPGNVRELRNAMERAVLLSHGGLIMPEHLPARVQGGARSASAGVVDAGNLAEIEQQAILVALRKHEFNRTETAKALGISRRALLYKIQRMQKAGLDVG